jgi:hypothetical protein
MSTAASTSREYARQKRRDEQERLQARTVARLQREEARRNEIEADMRERSIRLLLRYEAYFLPLLQEWLGNARRLDPLRNEGDAFALLSFLAQKGVEYSQQEEQGYFTVLVTMQIPGGWKTGRQTGDTLAEAFVFAVWEMIEHG